MRRDTENQAALTNGRRMREALAITEPGGLVTPDDRTLLLEAADDVLRRLSETDEEREVVDRVALSGWAVRPDAKALLGTIERRATDADERELLQRARKFRTYLPSAWPEPAPDLELERKIAEATGTRDGLQKLADRALDQLILVRAELRKARKPEEVEQLSDQARQAEAELASAQTAVDLAQSRLAQLTRQRERRRQALMYG